ncbi:MAG TPA: hypothetical protein VEH81_14185 [Ktedonobacteraceae bacterium]|nr:hypothetical protein [Ktedonobacteraceae bacterium]
MNLRRATKQSTVSSEWHDAHTKLYGHWLVLARMFWFAIFILTLVVFCANLLVGHYGLTSTIVLVGGTSVWFAISFVLFWRKSSDQAVLLFSLLLVLTGGVLFPPIPVALVNYGAWWIPVWALYILAAIMLSAGYTFPDGRFIPGFTRWLALGWIAVSLVPIPILGAVNHLSNWWLSPLYTLVRIVFYCSLALALLYRYRRRSTSVQRQQIKWLVYAAIVVAGAVSVANLVVHVLPPFFPELVFSTQLHQLISILVFYLLSVLIPLAIGIAILRYRLYDIDIIINRTLVYGLLTGTLISVYFILIFAMQFLVRSLTGQVSQSPVIIVASTLAIAALSNPLLRRIQAFIDRRFYRSKYDAAKTLAAFSATLRNEVDLEHLRANLVAVVQETMQPTYVSLWLCKNEHNKDNEAISQE